MRRYHPRGASSSTAEPVAEAVGRRAAFMIATPRLAIIARVVRGAMLMLARRVVTATRRARGRSAFDARDARAV